MITTIHGELDERTLEKREGVVDDAREHTTWVEYRLPGSDEIIHRSVHVTLKASVPMQTAVGQF